MHKLKTQLLMILLLNLVMQPLSAQQSQNSKTDSENNFGIEPQSYYQGTKIIELLTSIETEASTAIEEAYKEGYKAAVLEYKPDLEYYKTLAEGLEIKLETIPSNEIPWWSLPVSFVFGFGCNTLLDYLMR